MFCRLTFAFGMLMSGPIIHSDTGFRVLAFCDSVTSVRRRGGKTEAGNEAAGEGERRPDSFLGRSEKLEIFFKALFESQNLLERAKGNNRGRFWDVSQKSSRFCDKVKAFTTFRTYWCGRIGNWRGKKHLGIKKWGCFLCAVFLVPKIGAVVFSRFRCRFSPGFSFPSCARSEKAERNCGLKSAAGCVQKLAKLFVLSFQVVVPSVTGGESYKVFLQFSAVHAFTF